MTGFIINGFNVGTDVSFSVQDNFGDAFPLDALGLLMEADMKSMDKKLDVTPISNGGVPLFLTIWAGVSGSFSFTRTDGSMQNMIMDLMDAYFSSGIIPIFSMQASVLNRDQSIDEYQLSGLQWNDPSFGNFRAEKEVDQKIEFRASLLTRTGGAAPFLTQLAA
jgi:hypothetical protein